MFLTVGADTLGCALPRLRFGDRPFYSKGLLLLLVVRVDVFGVDDVIGLFTRPRAGAVRCTAGTPARLRTRPVHRFSNLVRCLSERIGGAVDCSDVTAF